MSTIVRYDVTSVRQWRHRIRLPDGSVTPGTQDTPSQLSVMQLPADLAGKRVLDVGMSDGFFAFECERRGATVIGLDNYSSPYIDSPSGFQVAKQILNSRVELVVGDFLTFDLQSLGKFDLVLFLGVLYHLRDPLGAIDRLASINAEQTIIETHITRPLEGWKWSLIRRLAPEAFPAKYMIFGGPGASGDASTWWIQSPECVESMMRACGFVNVHTAHRGWNRGVFHGFKPEGLSIAAHAARQWSSAEEQTKQYVQADGYSGR
jgi:tRNA (mo5U34)-methyltransferase